MNINNIDKINKLKCIDSDEAITKTEVIIKK